MATYFARSNGNINGSIWATTPSGTGSTVTFVAGDVLVANSFTVTVNVSTDLGGTGEVRNDTTGGATAGGLFSLSNGVTLMANVFAGSATCVTLASTASATVVGNVTGGTAASAFGVSFTSTGTLTLTGSVTGGTAAAGLNVGAAGTLTMTGNVSSSSSLNGRGINNAGFLSTLNITGNVTGTSNAEGIAGNSAYNSTITGNVTANGMTLISSSVVTIVGTATGGVNAGVTGSTASQLTVTRAKGGPLASSAVGVASAATTGWTTVEEIEYGDLGASPTSGSIRFVDKGSNVAVMYRFNTSKKTLTDASASSALLPATSDVRKNIVYNAGTFIGTMNVPAAASVALGVAVDNTTGTAVLTSGNIPDIWNVPVSSISVSGSIGERLKNCSTVASMGQQLAAALNNVQ